MKKNKTGLVVGLAVAAGAAWLLLRRPAAPGTSTTPTGQAAAPGGTATGSNSTAGLLNSLINLGKSIFGGGSSTPSSSSPYSGSSYTPPSLANTGGSYGDPAGGINYIDPTAPTLNFTAPPPADTTWNPDDYGLGDIFT